MRAVFVNENIEFERTGDPKKGLNVGRDRKMSGKELERAIVANIWPKISEDPFYLDKVSGKEELRQELEGWVNTIVDMWEVQRPSELGSRHFREYWKDIFAGL